MQQAILLPTGSFTHPIQQGQRERMPIQRFASSHGRLIMPISHFVIEKERKPTRQTNVQRAVEHLRRFSCDVIHNHNHSISARESNGRLLSFSFLQNSPFSTRPHVLCGCELQSNRHLSWILIWCDIYFESAYFGSSCRCRPFRFQWPRIEFFNQSLLIKFK